MVSRGISIHAPHKGCDFVSTCTLTSTSISIHAPHKGCDSSYELQANLEILFQSTHPTRGATRRFTLVTIGCTHFNPRTPQGVRPAATPFFTITQPFQSTHPTRGATTSAKAPAGPFSDFNPRTPQGVRLSKRPC